MYRLRNKNSGGVKSEQGPGSVYELIKTIREEQQRIGQNLFMGKLLYHPVHNYVHN